MYDLSLIPDDQMFFVCFTMVTINYYSVEPSSGSDVHMKCYDIN